MYLFPEKKYLGKTQLCDHIILYVIWRVVLIDILDNCIYKYS